MLRCDQVVAILFAKAPITTLYLDNTSNKIKLVKPILNQQDCQYVKKDHQFIQNSYQLTRKVASQAAATSKLQPVTKIRVSNPQQLP